ncbi:OmpA family protein [Sinomicrobium pectinilyticum]|nr:OmpA family protein [Sinomicrobium pectinilyticum]
MSAQNEKVVIVPDQFVYFMVSEWYPDTTEEEKKRDLTWMRQDTGRKTIIRQMTLPISKMYGVKLPKKLCGPYSYYIEASLFGKRDPADTGLYVNGYCPPRITGSKWSTRNGGRDERKSKKFAYGETIYLNLSTEGLNGCTDLSVEIYNIQTLRGDKRIFTYNRIQVIDGEVNLEIRNSSSWQPLVNNIQEEEKFYIKVKNGRGQYIIDNNNDDIHARFLRIKNELVSNEPERPKNLTPVRIGKPQLNMERYEPCKFETISITETEEKDGKVQQKKVVVFENGKNLSGVRAIPELVNRTVYFDFDSAAIESQSRSVLDNTLRFLLEHEHSTITLNGYACVIGKADYNKTLSLRRSQAIKQYLTDGGLSSSRILSNGKGEILLDNNRDNDTRNGADNLQYKDEKEYIEARRVDISFTFYGHNAQIITYETTAPDVSLKKDLTIDIVGFETKSCFRNEDNKHRKEIKIIDTVEASTKVFSSPSFIYPVYSELSRFELFPIQYIWPYKTNPNNFAMHLHSCRYYSNEKNIPVLIKTYPDVKWKLNFFLNLTNDLSVRWQNMDPYEHKELQERAGKIGAEKRWEQKDVSFGFSLEGQWNMAKNGNYLNKDEFKLKYETKFKKLYDLFSSIGAMSDGITSTTKGKARSVSPRGLPVSFAVKPPNFSLAGTWYLSKVKSDEGKELMGTNVDLDFDAKPLIGLEMTIDLLGGLVFAASGVVSGGTAASGALELYKQIQGKLKRGVDFGDDDAGFKANVDIYMDLIISNEIITNIGFKFNTAGKRNDSAFKIEADNRLKIELKVGIKVKGELVLAVFKAKAYFEASASAQASITFGHGITYDDTGLSYRPKLGFDGLDAKYVVVVSVGLAMKIAKDKDRINAEKDKEWVLAEGEYKNVIPRFDVIKNLEELFDMDANIPLIKN